MSATPRKSSRRIPILRRKLAGVSITIQRCRTGPHAARVVIHSNGKRRTKFFETIEAAKVFAQLQEIEAKNSGARAATEIGDNERRVMLHSKEELAKYGKSISDAVKFYLAHLRATERSATVSATIEALGALKEKEGVSARYMRDVKGRLEKFGERFGARPLASITAEEISDWLMALDFGPVTKRNYRRLLAVLFNYGAERGLCAAGIMRKTIRLKATDAEPGILTVAECTALLRGADERVRAGLALALFTGIRDAELRRLDWRSVDLEGETLIVGAGIAKISQRRTIPIRPNLRAWLEPLRQLGGPVLPDTWETRKLVDAARLAAGFGHAAAGEGRPRDELRAWPHNALRHCYASYRLAKWPDAAALALEMGNSPGIILRHYRSLVKTAAAEAFWNLAPSTTLARNVATMPAGERRTA